MIVVCYLLIFVVICVGTFASCLYIVLCVAICCYFLLSVAAQIVKARASQTFKNSTLKPKRNTLESEQKKEPVVLRSMHLDFDME